MQLKYQLDTLVPAMSSDNKRSKCTECWNLEQIGDFVRKLGFLDKDEGKDDDIKNFLHLNQVKNFIFPCAALFYNFICLDCSQDFWPLLEVRRAGSS